MVCMISPLAALHMLQPCQKVDTLQGKTKLALYGLGFMREERLARAFQMPGQVLACALCLCTAVRSLLVHGCAQLACAQSHTRARQCHAARAFSMPAGKMILRGQLHVTSTHNNREQSASAILHAHAWAHSSRPPDHFDFPSYSLVTSALTCQQVSFQRPAEATDEWFNVFVLHQNRVQHYRQGPNNAARNVQESFLPAFLDLVRLCSRI